MLNLNINSDSSNINDYLNSWFSFENRPNQLIIHNSYIYYSFIELVKITSVNKVSEMIPADEDYIINDRCFGKISDNIFLSYVILDRDMDEAVVTDLTFFYKNNEDVEAIYDILDILEEFVVEDQVSEKSKDYKNTLNIITVSNSNIGLDVINVEETQHSDIYYSKLTNKKVRDLVKKIKKSKKGLSIFYGDKGTGKTSMIKNISKDINKDIFFIPNNLIDQVVLNPEFINFIKKNNECILVFDDFELAIDNSRYNPIVNNIIQMVDSLISDIVSVNIILIFNTEDVSEIEDSIDCNNIIDVVEFEHLNEEESNKLSEYLGDKTRYKNKNRLIDIIRGKNTNNKKRVGF